MEKSDSKLKPEEKIDYSNLPFPVPFEEISREAYMSLKPELFEGFRFEFNRKLNQKFSLSHSLMMGPTDREVPSQIYEICKIPTSNYEFAANFIDPKLMLIGRVMTDGKQNVRAKCDLTDSLTLNANGQLSNDKEFPQGAFAFDYKGSDYRTRLQIGSGSLFAANYIQVSLATDFIYNFMSRDVTASVGYDCIFRQSRLRGKIDSNGVAAAYLEEQMGDGLRFLVSAEMDHGNKDYKFGFGVNFGELF
ncbi:unnamed protein product [Cochlearia groenlandica]